jgi:multiple sugar transport system permease protein
MFAKLSQLSRQERRRFRVGLLFALPWIVGFLGFTLYPVIVSLYYSLNVYTTFGQRGMRSGRAAQLQRTADRATFWLSLYNTLYMVVLGIPFHLLLTFLLALLLNMNLRGISVYRTIFTSRPIVPVVATSILWTMSLDPERGLIDAILDELGRTRTRLVDLGPDVAEPSLILMGTWTRWQHLVIFLAGLQEVPPSALRCSHDRRRWLLAAGAPRHLANAFPVIFSIW